MRSLSILEMPTSFCRALISIFKDLSNLRSSQSKKPPKDAYKGLFCSHKRERKPTTNVSLLQWAFSTFYDNCLGFLCRFWPEKSAEGFGNEYDVVVTCNKVDCCHLMFAKRPLLNMSSKHQLQDN